VNYHCYIFPCIDHNNLRLVGGIRSYAGTLMFQMNNGTWGTVCSHGFDDDAASVACKQLGFDDTSNQDSYSTYYKGW